MPRRTRHSGCSTTPCGTTTRLRGSSGGSWSSSWVISRCGWRRWTSPGKKNTASTPRESSGEYMGCAGRVANGVHTVYCSYATAGGHALVGARIYLPAEQLQDPDRRAALGVGADVVFRTKPQLAQDILADLIADETMPPWAAGDEVYGRSSQLRTFVQEHGIGYWMRV